MNVLDLFTKVYAKLHNYPGIPFWVLTPARELVRFGANKILPRYLAKPHKLIGHVEPNLIVSFTSFPARINEVWQVVECMLRQSYKPAKIILWLSKDQFPSIECVPQSLRDREDDVFEIRLVEGDIRSHKKYYYVFKEYADALIFLIDDDIYYPTNILERAVKAHKEHPSAVICNYGYHVGYSDAGILLPYNSWQKEYNYSESLDLFFGSGGGTLINPSMLYKDIADIDLARNLTPIADDIWLNAMVNLAGLKKVILQNGQILPVDIDDNIKLAAQNRENNQNDIQLNSVVNYYMEKMHINPFAQQ